MSPVKGLKRLAERNDDERGKKESEGEGRMGWVEGSNGAKTGAAVGVGRGDSQAEERNSTSAVTWRSIRAFEPADQNSALSRSAPSVAPPLARSLP